MTLFRFALNSMAVRLYCHVDNSLKSKIKSVTLSFFCAIFRKCKHHFKFGQFGWFKKSNEITLKSLNHKKSTEFKTKQAWEELFRAFLYRNYMCKIFKSISENVRFKKSRSNRHKWGFEDHDQTTIKSEK